MIRQWIVLYRKEMLEMRRSYKWLWVPLVFILLGASQPLTTYYMPDILQASGGLPDGTVIQIPMPSGVEMMATTLSQFGSVGVLILVLACMGVVSGERVSGVVHMVMMKPVSHRSYMTSKWAGMVTLAGVSFAAGTLAAWYYTELLIGDAAFSRMALSMLLYGLWLMFIMSVTLLMSTLFRSGGSTAFLTIGIVFVLSILTSTLPKWMRWSPAKLTEHSNAFLLHGSASASGSLALCLCVTIIFIALLLEGAAAVFRSSNTA